MAPKVDPNLCWSASSRALLCESGEITLANTQVCERYNVSGGVKFCASLYPKDLRIIEDCGHLLMRERHDEVNDLIAGFLFNDGALYGKE